MNDLERIYKMGASNTAKCYLVWSISARTGLTDLRAICTTPERANYYRKGLDNDEEIIRTWVEQAILDHLYGWGMLASFSAR